MTIFYYRRGDHAGSPFPSQIAKQGRHTGLPLRDFVLEHFT